MNYGIKVTKPGIDVFTKPDSYANIKKFSLLSSTGVSGAGFSLLKVSANAKLSIANGATETIAHGLSYTPIVWVFMEDGSSNLVPVYDDTSSTYMYVDGTFLLLSDILCYFVFFFFFFLN